MKKLTNIKKRKLILQWALSMLLAGVVVIAFASKGGGDKKKNVITKSEFAPINISGTFTLKNGISYMGSYFLNQQKERNNISANTVITYQNGNTIYIMPYKYKFSIAPINNSPKNNLQLLDLKIKVNR
ncbi:MAG: hypothetical protein JST47_12980 [Bacteroidetes bacterium]|nr:hypothetical protein [Bacteroidota bacterium]MBS1974466.1 hypothetical protein [Bacteroidota bacterium]